MALRLPIYLDYNATTPVDPAVVAEMEPYLLQVFGNPSSAHAYGHQAKDAVDWARTRISNLLHCGPDELIFTAGGSESNNLAIKGVAFAAAGRGKHLITTVTEHPAVLATCQYLEQRHGFAVTYLPVDQHGRVDPQAVAAAIRPDTILISVMLANNETGSLQPVAEIGALARKAGVLFHTDAAQAVGKIAVNVETLQVDLLTVAGHKLYAPKGIGVLYVRQGVHLDSLIHGAGHELGRRAGTENVPYIAGLGKACAMAQAALPDQEPRLAQLRDLLLSELRARLDRVEENGHPHLRLPNTLNLSIPGLPGYELLSKVREVAASTGSACHAGTATPSPVLKAMGLSHDRAVGAVRLSLGRWTTREEVLLAASLLAAGARELQHGK